MGFQEDLKERLAEIRDRGHYREMKTLGSPHGTRAIVDGRACTLFNSNDYLGLASHPRVILGASKALETWGFGAPASRLMSGNTSLHKELESALARFKGAEDALLFPTGYMANLGVLTALVEPGDRVLSDAMNHASLVDACRLTRADVRVYPHLDVEAVKKELASLPRKKRAFLVTDAVFSMDGDVAPLPELRDAADAAGAWLVVDEAHSTGVLGETGRGIREHFGGSIPIEVSIGTLGKALGGQGGFVAGSGALVDLLRNRARTFFYTTAPLPALCAGVMEALAILEEEPQRVLSLRRKAGLLRDSLKGAGVNVLSGCTPIVPIVIGPSARTMEAARSLFERGFFVTGVRPPTVRKGTSRLRAVVNEPHTEDDIRAFKAAVVEALRETGRKPL